jgi:ribose transport system permease protein
MTSIVGSGNFIATTREKAVPVLKKGGAVIALLVIVLFFSVADSHFATKENIQAILEAAALPLVLAIGATFVILMGSIDLSLEGIMGLSCVVTAITVANTENANSFGIGGIVLALCSGLLFGALNGLLNIWIRLPSIMATIGTWFLGLGCAYLLFPDHQPNVTYVGLTNLVSHRVGGLNLLVWLAFGLLVCAQIIFRFTPLGRRIYAIGGDERTARAAGLPVSTTRLIAFSIAGLFSAIGGVFITAQLQNGYPGAGRDMLFPTIGAAVIGGTLLSGGRGGPFHSAIGVLILTVLQNGMIQLGLEVYSRTIVVGLAIIFAVVVSNWHLRQKLRVIK